MCLCGSEKTQFRNELKRSINAGRYTADYLLCGDLPYPAWKMRIPAHLSYRRIRRYLVWRLKRLEARDFSHVRIEFLIHLELTWLRDWEKDHYDLGDNEIHLAFTTDDMEASHKKHEEMGCICFENLAMGIYFITDPDGYWLEIVPEKM